MLSGGQILEFPQPALTFPIGYDPKEPFKVGFMVGSDGVCYWPLFEQILFIVHSLSLSLLKNITLSGHKQLSVYLD